MENINEPYHIEINSLQVARCTHGTTKYIDKPANSCLRLLKIINEDNNCYRRSSVIENLDKKTVTYNFISRDLASKGKVTNDLCITLPMSLLKIRVSEKDQDTFEEVLNRQMDLANDPKREREFTREQAKKAREDAFITWTHDHKEQIKDVLKTGAAIAGVVAILAGVAALSNYADANLNTNSPYEGTTITQQVTGAPEGYMTPEQEEEREKALQEANETYEKEHNPLYGLAEQYSNEMNEMSGGKSH